MKGCYVRSPGGDILIHIMICFPRNAFHSHVICISFPLYISTFPQNNISFPRNNLTVLVFIFFFFFGRCLSWVSPFTVNSYIYICGIKILGCDENDIISAC